MNLFGMAEPATQPININSDSSSTGVEISGPSGIENAFASLLVGLPITTGQITAPLATEDLPAQGRQPIPKALQNLVQPEASFEQKLALPTMQQWAVTLTHQRPVDVKPGNYQILKQDISNGTLKLELAPQDPQSAPIKVSIPIELLHQESRDAATGATKQTVSAQRSPIRVPVTVYSTDTTELEQLIGKVNLREMEISVNQSNAVYRAVDEPMTVQLLAEQTGQKFVLAGKLDKAQLRATSVTKQSMPTAAVLPTGENPTPAAEFGLTVDSVGIPRRRMTRPVAFAMEEQAKTDDFKLIEKLMSVGSKDTMTKQDGFEQLSAGTKIATTQSSLDQKLEMPRVKITLPQDLPQLKPDGKSVLLKIEPEHLGPAKLHLTMRNETLSARVTVDSLQAKAAIDGSLDQLTDQLARAGVKVDYIDVGVRGGGAENQFSHRQAEWFRSQQPRVMKIADDLLAEAARIIPATMPVSYLGAGSVNLFA
jgi:flagellar hook-length control protein FliK